MATATSKKLTIVVEKGPGNLSAKLKYRSDLLTTTAKDLGGIKRGFLEQLEGFYDIPSDQVEFKVEYEVSGFFETHKYINVSELGKVVDINPSLLRHYASGLRRPNKDQLKKIENGVQKIGREMAKIALV